MAKKNCDVGRRAWNILRMALLWVREGGVFNLRVVPKFTKSFVHTRRTRNKINYYFEREISFDKTPIIHLKMNRPGSSSMRFHLPCFNPKIDDDDDDDELCGIREEKSIDDKAEEFITNFYEQLKLQRQNSYLQYN